MKRKQLWKKFAAALTALLLVFVAACGGGSGQSAQPSPSQQAGGESPSPSQAAGGSGGGQPSPKMNLIISHFWPAQHPMQQQVLTEIFDALNKNSGGNITYEFYPANALGQPGSHYDLAVTGEADVAMSVHGYTAGRFPLVGVVEIPFVSESGTHGSKIMQKLLEEFPAIQQHHADTTPLFLFTADPAQIVSVKHRIEKPEDMKGLRVRTPSQLGSRILEALGATPVSMPMSDVYEALSRGVIDAAMAPLEALEAFSLHEIAKYVTVGHFSSTPFFVVMNTNTFNSLSDSDKELLRSMTGMVAAEKAGGTFDASGIIGKEKALKNGAEFIELTGEKLEPWKKALDPVAQEWIKSMEDQGFPAQEIYNRALELKEELR